MGLLPSPAPRSDLVDHPPLLAEELITEQFTNNPKGRWRFVADTVMGGVSSGELAFIAQEQWSYARMTGIVSTANNGGFIQMRSNIAVPPPPDTTAVRLIARGNDQRYFVHLRTREAIRPMQYYQAGFDVTQTWREICLPFRSFAASGGLLREPLHPSSLTSIGIVAYGRDHEAEIEVRQIGFC